LFSGANKSNLVYNLVYSLTMASSRFVCMNAAQQNHPLAEYYLQTLRWRDLYRVFLPLILLVLGPLGYGLYRTLYGYSSFGPAAAASWGTTWFMLSGFLVIPLLFYALRRLRRAHTWLKIYSWGVEYHQPLRRKKKLSWNDIQGITTYSVRKTVLGLVRKTKHHLILYSANTAPFHCHPDLTEKPGLKKVIKQQVYETLKPKLITAFNEGKTIPFGGVSISREQLILPKKNIPWKFLEGISVEKGSFLVKLTAQNSIEVPIRNLINLEILIHLIKTEI
jgi:hypothetical protein